MHGVNFVPFHFIFSYLFVSHSRRLFIPLLLISHVSRVIFAPFYLRTIFIFFSVRCQLRDILYFCAYGYNSCHLHIYDILFLSRFSCRFHGSLSCASVSISLLSLSYSFFFRVNFALLFFVSVLLFSVGEGDTFFSLCGGRCCPYR